MIRTGKIYLRELVHYIHLNLLGEKVAYELHQEGVPLAEIARHVGVCTSTIVKAIGYVELEQEK
jgi:IS30 family transposase